MPNLAEKILVGVDDSEESWTALDYAIEEAKKKGLDKLTVAHSNEVAKEAEAAQFLRKEFRSGEDILEEAESRGEKEGIEIETHLIGGGHKPDVALVKFAEEKGFDQVIVGHRGRTGIGRMLLGSVAESVVKKCHCPVTVVRE